MKVRHRLSSLLLPFLLIASLCACSRYIEGEVFLDKNGNNIRDFGESVVSGIGYSVTQNGSKFFAGQTDDVGQFLVTMDSSKEGISYCVDIDTETIPAVPNPGAPGKALEASVDDDEAEATPEATSSAEEDDEDEEEVDSNACPKESDGQPKCSDSRCADEAACDTHVVKSKQACDKSKLAEMKMKLDVPIAVDYSTRLAKVENPEQTAYVGETIALEIVYPYSCTFQPFVLPRGLKVSIGNAYDAMTREVFLARAVAERPSQILHNDVPRFGHDELVTYLLPVEVIDEGDFQNQDIELQPKVKCPDGKEIATPVQILHLRTSQSDDAKDYQLSSEMAAGCPELGESGVMTGNIEAAAGNTGIPEAVYTLEISGGGSYISMEDVPGYCNLSGSSVECEIEGNASLSKLAMAFNFKISDSIPKPAKVTFTPKLKVGESSLSDTPIECEYP
jgi:hypothetical protein